MTSRFVVRKRRKREGKTNYHKRLKLLLGRTTRLVVRTSLNHVRVQLVDYSPKGDIVRVSADTTQLKKLGWKGSNNLPAAYLCGMLAARKALKAGITNAIVDIGLSATVKGSKVFAAVKGALAGELKLPVSESILPADDRVNGKHIGSCEKKGNQFLRYEKAGLDPKKMEEHVAELKKKIMEL